MRLVMLMTLKTETPKFMMGDKSMHLGVYGPY